MAWKPRRARAMACSEATVLLGRSGIEVWQLTDLRAETCQAGSLEATETIAAENGTPRVLLAPELGLAVLSYFCRFSRNIWDSLMFCDISSHLLVFCALRGLHTSEMPVGIKIRKTLRHADRGCPWRSVFRFLIWPSLEQIFEPRNIWCQTFPKVQYLLAGHFATKNGPWRGRFQGSGSM